MSFSVFISHSGPDLPVAKALGNALLRHHISYWLDSDAIPMGTGFVRHIGNALRNCRIFILIGSDMARRSYWVNREMQAIFRLRNNNPGMRVLKLGNPDAANDTRFDFVT